MASQFNNPFDKALTPSSATGTIGKLNTDDVEDKLSAGADDDKVEDKVEDKVDDKEDKEKTDDTKDKDDDKDSKSDKEDDDEDDEKEKIKLKDEEDEEEEEKLDLKEDEQDVTAPPRRKDIETAFPDIFKKFPFLDKMLFRDKAYTEMFGSFDEAKEVFGKVERLNEFESQLMSGNTIEVLKATKEADPKAFDKIVDNYLKNLSEVDPEAYRDVVGNFSKSIVLGMVSEAKKKFSRNPEDKDARALDDAARQLYEYLFDEPAENAKIEFKTRAKEEKSEEAEKVKQERTEFMRERFNAAKSSLTQKVDNVLKATIADYIDPRGVMTVYEKKNAVTEALSRLHGKVAEDPIFRKNLDKLWRAAFSNRFSEETLGAIKKSYLGKSRNLISSVIKDVRSEVLKDNRSKGKEDTKDEDKEKEETPRERKNVNAGRPHQQDKKANDRKPGETVEEFLSR